MVTVVAHSGLTAKGMLNYIKPIVRKKPDVLIIRTGTNDLPNLISKMKEVKELVRYIRAIDD